MKTVALIAASLFVIAPALAQDKGKLSSQDSRALSKLIEANMAEVETGKLAQQKAQNPEIKQFGQHMVDDHGKMLSEMQKMAQSKGVKAPASPDRKHQAAMKKLQSADGARFDEAYAQQMVKDHQDTLKLVQKTAKDAKDPELKAAAQKAAPDIQEHLKMAQGLSKSSSSSKGSSSQGSSSKKSSSAK